MEAGGAIKARGWLAGTAAGCGVPAPPAIPDHEMLRCIGRGSYGEVWLARNAIGTSRAVKVVHRDRFQDSRPYEREFSGIQKYEPISRTNEGLVDVLQIGRNHAEGYFYYVMELADSAELTGDYIPKTLAWEIRGRGRLPIEECVTLGLTLNLALGHLHRHGLIHRDVKPSNIIFVNGVPKLADIGLVTDLAEAKSFVGTEGFIPPEGPNSPQADLYALGKVLYEAGMGKDRTEFPEPYSELGLDADSRKLMDLNAVLLKACASKPRERYQTAEEMNADLALLHSGQSVRDKHALERRLKVTRRVAVGVAATLVLGVVPYYLALREARLARDNERKAQTEAVKSQQEAQFLKEMLGAAGPSVALGRDTTMLKEILDKTAQRVGRDLAAQPEVQAELQNTIGDVFSALGKYSVAEAMHRQALATRRKLFGSEHPAVAESMNNLAKALMLEGKLSEAENLEREALTMRKRLLGPEQADVAASLSGLGGILFNEGRRSEAESAYREALTMRRKLLGNENPEVAASLGDLGDVVYAQGKFFEAESTYREALDRLRKSLEAEHPEVAKTLNKLAQALAEEGKSGKQEKFVEAESRLREALTIYRKLMGNENQLTDQTLDNLVEVLQRQGKLTEAETLCREDLALSARDLGADAPRPSLKLSRLAGMLRAEKKAAEAAVLEEEALASARILARSDPPAAEISIARMAGLLSKQGQYAAAEALCREALNSARMLATNDPARLEDRVAALAVCLKAQFKWDEAESLLREAMASERARLTNDPARLEMWTIDAAEVFQSEGKLAEAERSYLEGLALKQQRVGENARDVGLLFRAIAYVYELEGKLPEAASAYRQSAMIAQKSVSNEHPEDAAWSLYGLAWILQKQGRMADAEKASRETLESRKTLKSSSGDALVVGDSLYQLAVILWAENKFDDAEAPARECLALYESKAPNSWQMFNARSTLGALLGSCRKYAEAEPLILSACQGLTEHEHEFPAAFKPRLREAIEHAFHLYSDWGRPDQAATWKRKLDDFDQQLATR